MRFQRLADWLSWQEQLHFTAVDPGLERIREVYGRLWTTPPPFAVVTIAGTNGKGSTAAFLESLLDAAGHEVGCFTSPHLVHYNERIRIGREPVGDETIMAAFDAVDRARGTMSLTYFEFGTLAALEIFRRREIAVAVLEVGMGGRLDAVNVVDPDVAVITPIGMDHTDYLGADRETIATEKAGVLRPGRPAVCTDPAPPAALLERAEGLGAPLACLGADFGWSACRAGGWRWWSRRRDAAGAEELPAPALVGRYQLDNAAGALEAVAALGASFPLPDQAAAWGVARARVPGRLEVRPGPVSMVLDVAHNPDAARSLAAGLAETPPQGRDLAVTAMLADKDHRGVFRELANRFDGWWCCGLASDRSASAETLMTALREVAPAARMEAVADPVAGLAAARAAARPGDRIVVFGSFLTVGAILWAEPPVPAAAAV